MRNPPQTAARRLSGGARGVVVESWPSRPGTRCVWLVVRARRTWRGPTTSTTPSAAPQRDSTPPLPVASAPTTPASDATSPRTGADRPRGEDRADFVVPWWRSRPRKPLSRSYLRPRGRGLRYERATYPTNTRRSLKGGARWSDSPWPRIRLACPFPAPAQGTGGHGSTPSSGPGPLPAPSRPTARGSESTGQGVCVLHEDPPTCSTPDPPPAAPHPRSVHAERHRGIDERPRPPGLR